MGTFIQSYASGYIARDGDKYQYVENEKVLGTYDTIDQLVGKHTPKDGKQTTDTKSSVDGALGTADVAPKSAAKGKTKSAKAKS